MIERLLWVRGKCERGVSVGERHVLVSNMCELEVCVIEGHVWLGFVTLFAFRVLSPSFPWSLCFDSSFIHIMMANVFAFAMSCSLPAMIPWRMFVPGESISLSESTSAICGGVIRVGLVV